MIYQIYILNDPRKSGNYSYESIDFSFLNEPFYVGKTNNLNNRKLSHFNESKGFLDTNNHKCNIIRKLISLGLDLPFTIIKEFENEQEAFEYEKFLIKTIGRFDLGTGPLANKTDGGEGTTGRVVSDKTKKLLSLKMKERLKHPAYQEFNKIASIKGAIASKLKPKEEFKTYIKVSDELQNKICQMYNGGLSLANIRNILIKEDNLKLRIQKIINILDSHEIKLRNKREAAKNINKKQIPENIKSMIKMLYLNKTNFLRIQRETGINRGRVKRFINEEISKGTIKG